MMPTLPPKTPAPNADPGSVVRIIGEEGIQEMCLGIEVGGTANYTNVLRIETSVEVRRDRLTVVDLDVRGTGRATGDDIGKAIAIDIGHRHVHSQILAYPIGKEAHH